jgi:hypothetical protein
VSRSIRSTYYSSVVSGYLLVGTAVLFDTAVLNLVLNLVPRGTFYLSKKKNTGRQSPLTTFTYMYV